ncbi:MAG: hypothetical protein ABFS32_12505 [Bacteroidota bacterium]
MKILILLLPLLLGINLEKDKNAAEKLLGSWTLVEFKYGNEADYEKVPDFMYYIKNVTDTHFSWCSYNPESGEIVGAGGGTYNVNSKAYIESTDFWYPSGTSIPGTTTTFKYKLKGNMWTISGYIKEVELNPATGEMVPTDSTYISEKWQKIGGR